MAHRGQRDGDRRHARAADTDHVEAQRRREIERRHRGGDATGGRFDRGAHDAFEARATRSIMWGMRSLRWMDHWLRHAKGGRGPAFTYYRDWTKYRGTGADDEHGPGRPGE